MYSKYNHVWLQARGREDDDKDRDELYESFSLLEEKVLAQYTSAKLLALSQNTSYLLDAGLQWRGAPDVKGVDLVSHIIVRGKSMSARTEDLFNLVAYDMLSLLSCSG